MRSAWRIRNRNTGREAGALAESAQPLAEALLAAVKMLAAGQIEPQPVGWCRRGDWCPTTHGAQSQMVE